MKIESTILIEVYEAYERDGSRCAAYLKKVDAENCDLFENGCDVSVNLTKVVIGKKELEELNRDGFIIVS
jgi:hypothetical protein